MRHRLRDCSSQQKAHLVVFHIAVGILAQLQHQVVTATAENAVAVVGDLTGLFFRRALGHELDQ